MPATHNTGFRTRAECLKLARRVYGPTANVRVSRGPVGDTMVHVTHGHNWRVESAADWDMLYDTLHTLFNDMNPKRGEV